MIREGLRVHDRQPARQEQGNRRGPADVPRNCRLSARRRAPLTETIGSHLCSPPATWGGRAGGEPVPILRSTTSLLHPVGLRRTKAHHLRIFLISDLSYANLQFRSHSSASDNCSTRCDNEAAGMSRLLPSLTLLSLPS